MTTREDRDKAKSAREMLSKYFFSLSIATYTGAVIGYIGINVRFAGRAQIWIRGVIGTCGNICYWLDFDGDICFRWK